MLCGLDSELPPNTGVEQGRTSEISRVEVGFKTYCLKRFARCLLSSVLEVLEFESGPAIQVPLVNKWIGCK